ncbi:uncharacterized protein LOC122070520 isoform X2 [Macadamia integrifolia]|uniref:uncharacterized protein LOC122070520 isoform X2 n=1 Tax=Macadamia integrifolia TaxID=60698 RepID=UPI001C4F7D8C|nr:uncharacterized protein LOC122070520 isoform X2 [Macadamia integrifolia]
MEESDDRDFQGNFVRQTSLRQNGSLKSGKSTPRGSPSFRKLHFSRTPRREVRSCGVYLRWIASNPLLLWLFLIALWAYLGFHVQSRWAHGDDEEKMIGYGSKSIGIYNMEQDHQSENASTGNKGEVKNVSQLKRLDLSLAKNGNHLPSRRRKSKGSTGGRRLRGKRRGRQKGVVEGRTSSFEEWEVEIPKKNTSYGLFVGPFGSTEDRILGWNPEKRRSTCDRKGEFVHRVWSRKFVLIFHELSMTGAPLSMMELATELMSCGATVSSVVLSKKGGLMAELAKRKIKVLEDKAELSYKTAMKADLIIAGSAVCASWIGIPCSLNTPSFSVEKMMEKRQLLRDTVRKGMGLTDNDMLVMSLSSINTGKGQLLLLESARSVVGLDLSLVESGSNDLIKIGQGHSSLPIEKPSRAMFQNKHQISESSNGLYSSDKSTLTLNEAEQKGLRLRILHMPTNYTNTLSSDNDGKMRKILSDKEGTKKQKLKVLIGSVGSKSNKVPYVKSMLKFLSQHSNLSKSVLWTPATTRVASLYAAADVYIINSQGLGETFGRVTIEAMAFGLPVLGTDAGGTKEIVDHNITGLLHPIGHQGSKVLAQNIQLLLENPTVREQMAIKGRRKVESMYLKHHMYKKLADVLQKCMRIK